jgi:GT2 family glycosyltransferase
MSSEGAPVTPAPSPAAAPAGAGRRPPTFDVVIATRNRPDALALSIPLLLAEPRQPGKLIVIDSSDDHAAVARAVAAATEGASPEIVVRHVEKGLTFQRNVGLEEVTADVVLFPDDDSLVYPGTVEAIMEVYERDTDGVVVGVGPAEASEPPPGVRDAIGYDMSRAHRWQARTTPIRYRVGRYVTAINPRYIIARLLMDRAPRPVWLGEIDAVPVEWISGFRMSFRAEALRAEGGFDEILRGYSLWEDVDMSFRMARRGALIGARKGKIYHHRYPTGRPDAYRLSMLQMVNLGYLMAKHMEDSGLTSAERRRVRRQTRTYVRLRRLAAALRSLRNSQAAAERRGLAAGAVELDVLLDAPRARLGEAYLAAKARLGVE